MKPELASVALALSLFTSACGGRAAAPSPPPPPVPLHLEAACDLVPSAGLSWVVVAEPRSIAQIPDLIPALGLVFSEERLRAFGQAHGGIDLRQINEVCIARYPDALLAVARVPVETDRVLTAFEARSVREPRRTELARNPHVVRISDKSAAADDANAEELVVFGRDAVAWEQGKPGPLRAAEAFAFGKLKRAAPALRGAALARAVQVVGPAPVRAFAAGPFEGETARGLGGILRAATAVGGSARWTGGKRLTVRVVVTGAWGADGPAAAERLGAAANVLADSPAGRLFGLRDPIEPAQVHVEPDALVLDLTIDADALARGAHDALDADVADIMRR